MDENTILEVKDLKVSFNLDEGLLKAVDGVSFSIRKCSILGVIGESGCGKSMTARAILRIIPKLGGISNGHILLRKRDGEIVNIAALSDTAEEIRAIRGNEISMIFQEPMTSFSPVHTIGNQIVEAVMLHSNKTKKEARDIALHYLRRVNMPNSQQQIDFYPHQLSGGLRQRAMIAMALCCGPALLIADEPTTALDVTVQAQILELIQSLQKEIKLSILYITHNLGVIAEIADDVAVMYLGKVVETANLKTVFKEPLHPYTANLMKAIPEIGRERKTRLNAIQGFVPTPLNLPVRCGFFPRCKKAIKGLCERAAPALVEIHSGHSVRCFLYHKEEEA